MRLKEVLIIECFLADKKYSTKLLQKEILKQVTQKEFSSLMRVYRAARNSRIFKPKEQISNDTIAKLILLLESKMQHVRQKARKKGN